MKKISLSLVCCAWLLTACNTERKEAVEGSQESASIDDPHSFSRPEEVVTTHLSLEMYLNFEDRVIDATAIHTIRNHGADTFVVDAREDVVITGIRLNDADGLVTPVYSATDPVLGKAVKIPVSRNTQTVAIRYYVRETAAALGWLQPVQTAAGKAPFLYTQGQAILTRSWIPLQDSPGIRFTYDATVHVPAGMMAAMSATNPQERNAEGLYKFTMDRPVPGYLIALAAGDFDFAPIGARTGVYAEPNVLAKAKEEFADMEKMVEIAEQLYGPYQWDRYDVIVLPPSFPFGGMENPKLTFATPTIIAGDKSLVSLIAHELAHSWSGNLVTNATWNDFWLNEGFTTYFENRIMEALYGKEEADMLALLGYQDLEETVADLGAGSKDTHLRLDLKGRDPDDGLTSIAYEKGAFFLKRLEAAAGREKFDAFLRKYLDEHKFQSMSTDRFITYLQKHLLQPNNLDVNIDAWIDGPGIPSDIPVISSDRFVKVDSAVVAFTRGAAVSDLQTSAWTTQEWLHFIRHLPKQLTTNQLQILDRAFKFSKSGNSEIASAWYEHVLANKTPDNSDTYVQSVMPDIEAFLNRVGRRKFLMPIYRTMKENGKLEDARRIFAASQQNYHTVSNNSLRELLEG